MMITPMRSIRRRNRPSDHRAIERPLHADFEGEPAARLSGAQALLCGADTEFADHTDVDDDRGHGRTERRTLRVAPCDDTLFPGARQVLRLRRDTGGLDGVRTSKEIIHGSVSVGADLAGPEHLNAYARGHWTRETVVYI